MLTLDKIYHAAYVLREVARKTDLIYAPRLSGPCQVHLKTEIPKVRLQRSHGMMKS